VYGTIFPGNTNPQSTYSIDGTVLGSVMEPSTNYTQYNHLLWQSQTLSNNAHTIVITYHNGIGFWLDYLQYTTQAASPSPSPTPVNTQTPQQVTPQQVTTTTSLSTTIAQTSASHANSSTTTATTATSQLSTSLSQSPGPVLASSQSTPTQSPAASSSNRNVVGPVVGGVVGGLLLLSLLFFFLLRRRRRSREEIHEPISRATSPTSMYIPI
jgi:sensor c-di-GMP phosphodiesterase-like protein